jgi:hypothetical protein
MKLRLALALSLLAVTPGEGAGLKAGSATVDITPPTGYAMWGYAARRDAPSTGVMDRLQARALVLEVGEKRMALVSLDLGRAPTRASTAAIQERVKKSANVETLFLVASHTHHGPVIEIDTWPTPKTSYVRELEAKLGDVVVEAAKKLRPARLGVARKEAALNRNRHSKRADKPVDRELLVLRVEDDKGEVIAHAVNFAAHPTMIPAKKLEFSADYVGVLCAAVEKATKAPCLFLQGAAGDLSADSSGGRNTPATFGAAVAEEVIGLARTIRVEDLAKGGLATHEETFRFTPRVNLKNPAVSLSLKAAFYPEFISFYEREYLEGVRPALTVALLDERIGFVGVSGEVFCAHALHLKRRARLEHLFFLGYCNDYHQYFPTIEALAEGGYGTEPYIGTAEVGAGERIMDRALLRLYEMRGKIKP